MDKSQTASAVLNEILEERVRQITKEGWTPEHDDHHSYGQLAIAASCYAREAARGQMHVDRFHPPSEWPWERSWWKPKNPRNDLIRAAALIVAEIERLDRHAG